MGRLRLLLDEHLDPGVARGLRDAGIDAVAVVERPELRRRSDDELLDIAARERRTIVTRDVSTLRPLLRRRWIDRSPTWGCIFVAAGVRADASARPLLIAALARIAGDRPDEEPLEHELWIAVPPA